MGGSGAHRNGGVIKFQLGDQRRKARREKVLLRGGVPGHRGTKVLRPAGAWRLVWPKQSKWGSCREQSDHGSQRPWGFPLLARALALAGPEMGSPSKVRAEEGQISLYALWLPHGEEAKGGGSRRPAITRTPV